MGHVQYKYTRAYYLQMDAHGRPTEYGVAGLQDFRAGRVREHDRHILQQIDFRRRTVLDLGFGRGEALKYALENGARRAVGVDFSEAAVEIARQHLDRHSLKADLFCSDALRFFDEYARLADPEPFDVVMMLDFVEHVPRAELTEILASMRRWLSKRAVLCINTPVFGTDNDVLADGLAPRARDTSDEYEETSGMHCNRYTRRSLARHLKACGFVALSGHHFVSPVDMTHAFPDTPTIRRLAVARGFPMVTSIVPYKPTFEVARPSEQPPNPLPQMAAQAVVFARRARGFVLRRLGYRRRPAAPAAPALPAPQWLGIQAGPLKGTSMLLDLSSPAEWQREMYEGHFDTFLYDLLERSDRIRGATLWDVGAHIGYHSLAFAALAGPGGRVVAFEPNPHNVDRLQAHLERNPDLGQRITLMTCALGDADGVRAFKMSHEIDNGLSSGSHLASSLLTGQAGYLTFRETTVQVRSADSLLQEGRLAAPAVMKIDVEGTEAEVLAGARTLLNQARPLLIVEVHHIAAMHEVLSILLPLAYRTRILRDTPPSTSRCFIVAEPAGAACP